MDVFEPPQIEVSTNKTVTVINVFIIGPFMMHQAKIKKSRLWHEPFCIELWGFGSVETSSVTENFAVES